MFRALFFLTLFSCQCRPDGLADTREQWAVAPEQLDLGSVYVGHTSAGRLSVRNEARAAIELELTVETPFKAPARVRLGGGESTELQIDFLPTAPGAVSTLLRLSSETRSVEVPLTGAGLLVPGCGASPTCKLRRFDPTRAQCVETDAADGTACATACLTQATCQQGVCRGQARSCDDGNACTEDSCDGERGCVNRDVSSSCPAARSACEVATCRPAVGCGFEAKVDGTSCGPNDCTTAQVCIGGTCEARSSPDGSECAPAGICQAAATCRANRCVPGPVTPLKERWSYTPAAAARVIFEGTVDSTDGASYFTEAPLTGTDPLQLVSLSATGAERFRVDLELACPNCWARLALDPLERLVFVGRRGRVQARSMVDGRLVWERDPTVGKTPRSPLPDGGGSWSTSSFLSLGPDVIVEEVSEGNQLHRAYAIAFERTTGAVRWERDFWGHAYSPVATADDRLWFTAADCWAPIQQTVVFDVMGGTQQIVQRQAAPIAAEGNRVLLYGADLVWVGPTGVTAPLPFARGISWALVSPNRTVLRTDQGVQEYDDDGGLRWSYSTGVYAFAGTLLADGGTLTTESLNDGGSLLRRYDDRGATITCPLPGSGGVGAVFHGLWIAPITANQRTSIHALEIGPAELERTGWVKTNGSPNNDRRPRGP
jgi:hypothetical protein